MKRMAAGCSVLALLVVVGGSAAVGHSTTAAVALASVETKDYRVSLTAAKSVSSDAIPTASVSVRTSERRGGGWQRIGSRRLDAVYFWKTVTGPRAVCRLEIRTAGAAPRFRPYAVIQLLVSPSLGCGKAHRIELAEVAP